MIQTNSHHAGVIALALALAGCSPSPPVDGTTGTSDGPPITSATTDSSTFGETEQTAPTDETTSATPFACPDARWHEGALEIDDDVDIGTLRDVGGVTGSLVIAQTQSLADLEFLSCLEIVEGTVTIFENESLVSLQGLEQLRLVNGNSEGLKVWDLGLVRNPALQRIDSLDSLGTIGVMVVGANESLTEIEMAALHQVQTLSLGGYCLGGGAPEPDQPLTHVGTFPNLEHVETFELRGQFEFTSLESLIDLAERGVAFENAVFEHNINLPQSEIDAFAASASITPETCSNMDDIEECPPCPIE